MKINGIDVSEWQETINWSSVKSQISFVILREGYRRTTDKYFFKNIDAVLIKFRFMAFIILFTL